MRRRSAFSAGAPPRRVHKMSLRHEHEPSSEPLYPSTLSLRAIDKKKKNTVLAGGADAEEERLQGGSAPAPLSIVSKQDAYYRNKMLKFKTRQELVKPANWQTGNPESSQHLPQSLYRVGWRSGCGGGAPRGRGHPRAALRSPRSTREPQ